MIAVRCVDGLPFFTCVIRFVWRTWRCWVRMWLWTTSFTWTVPTCCLTNPSTNRSQSHESSCNIVWSKKKKTTFYMNSTENPNCARERERERERWKRREKKNKIIFFSLILIRLNSFLALLGCTVHQSEMMSIWFVKKSSPAHQTGL